MIVEGNRVKRRPADGRRASMVVRPSSEIAVSGNRETGLVGVFVDEAEHPRDHHAELAAVAAKRGDEG